MRRWWLDEALPTVPAALFMLLVVVLALFCGCIPLRGDPTPKPGQAEAERLVWHMVYGRNDAPPKVYWMEGDALDCNSEEGYGRGFHVWPFGCVDGAALDATTVMVVWDLRALERFWTTSLDHELAHVLQMRRWGPDPFHWEKRVWGRGGLREQAEDALKAWGR